MDDRSVTVSNFVVPVTVTSADRSSDTFLHEFWSEECADVEAGDGVELAVIGDGGGDRGRQVQRLRDDLGGSV